MASKIGKINIVVFILMLLLIGCAFGVRGQFSIVAFVLLKLYLPLIGIPLMVILVVWSVIRWIRKKEVTHQLCGIFICCMMSFMMLSNLGMIDIVYPAKTESLTSIMVEWPFREATVVGWGGNTVVENYHAAYPNIRYAYDLVMKPYDIGSQENADYGIWEQPIYSPVKGTVVGICNDEQDIKPNSEDFKSQLGNYVFIKIEETGTYLVLAHMKQGSVQVKEGEGIEAGVLLGYVGNSGTSSEPHLHIHHQKQNPTQVLTFAEGLPLYFQGINAESMPVKGTVVMPIQ